jgi:hypothetical protein
MFLRLVSIYACGEEYIYKMVVMMVMRTLGMAGSVKNKCIDIQFFVLDVKIRAKCPMLIAVWSR